MNFDNIIGDNIGMLHLIASMCALIVGTLNLVLAKGTRMHKRIGYFYAGSMSVLLFTAFAIYRLFGTWGIFHWTAVISTLTLLAGLLPVILKRPSKNYISLHFCFIYWSVIGLYGAAISETLVRMPKIVIESGIPNSVFYNMTGIGVGITMALGVFFFIKLKPKWDKQFGQK